MFASQNLTRFSVSTLLTGVALLSGPLVVRNAQAQGGLDPSFGTGGMVLTDSAGGYDETEAIALQPDGKVLVAGAYDHEFAVLRYLANGSLDAAFGSSGVARPAAVADFDATSIVVQGDGKILIAGWTSSLAQYYHIAVVRLNSDGSLDASFDVDGIVTTAILTEQFAENVAYSIALQNDGKIVVAGYTYAYSTDRYETVVIRYLQDGSLDSTFDSDGIVTFLVDDSSWAESVALQLDGKIILLLETSSPTDSDFVLARLDSNGALDSGFGSNGIARADLSGSGSDEVATSLAIQPDGRIVVAGESGSPDDFAVARLLADGSLDLGFGTNGASRVSFSNDSAQARGVSLQSDGKIILCGTIDTGSIRRFGIARLDAGGSLDTGFDGDGKVTTDFPGSYASAYGLGIQQDGKIILAGVAYDGTDFDIALARYVGLVWEDLGHGLTGSHGIPALSGSGNLLPGGPLTLSLSGALGSSTALLAVGLSRIDHAFQGGTMVPSLDLLRFLPTGPAGSITLNSSWPDGTAAGLVLYLQFWVIDPLGPLGIAASNAISGTGQ